MLRTKHLKMAVVPMTLLALLSTAVPVASAQETTDESFYELTTTPSGGDMIVGEPGTTILLIPATANWWTCCRRARLKIIR